MRECEVEHWDHECDVLVVGSGNGALTAALAAADGGAKVLVVEKAPQFGGTSASSGGGVWIPNNWYAVAAGAEDSMEDARAYLQHVSPEGRINPEMLETYVTEGPGEKKGSRSMEPEPLRASALGSDFKNLASQHPQTRMPGGVAKFNGYARVLHEDGTAIEGLYACGITTAALLPAYPGPGSTLGPAMVFGFLAGKHISSH